MQIVQNCEDKAVRDQVASEPWQKPLSTATYERIPTWSLGSYDAVIKLCLQWWHNNSSRAGAVGRSSARQLQGTACTPERGQWVCGIGAVQGGVGIRGVVNSNIADDIGSLLHTQTAGEKKTKTKWKTSWFSPQDTGLHLGSHTLPLCQKKFWLTSDTNRQQTWCRIFCLVQCFLTELGLCMRSSPWYLGWAQANQYWLPKWISYLAGLYLLSSSSSVSLRMVMTLTGGLGVSGITMGWCCSCTGTSTLEEEEVERRGLLPMSEYTWEGTVSRVELGLKENQSSIQLCVSRVGQTSTRFKNSAGAAGWSTHTARNVSNTQREAQSRHS